MKTKTFNNIKLGAFVLAGLIFLLLILYMIGKNRTMFGGNYKLRARFENVQGLKSGNNVRYAGIDVGTVEKVSIINDTIMEVKMIIDNKAKFILRKNAIVSIGTDGLVGNKVVNIAASKSDSPLAEENDILPTKKPIDTDEMLRTLNKTNNDIAVIARNLKLTSDKLNNSEALWDLLNDKSLPDNLKKSATNIRLVTNNLYNMSKDVNSMVSKIKKGEGSIGKIINDSSFAKSLEDAVINIKDAGNEVSTLSKDINKAVKDIENNINDGNGTVHALLKDTGLVIKINHSLDNIEDGTKGFNQNMDALKHSFLFRGYFRKLEKAKH